MRARIITCGATVTELWVPDRAGRLADVVLGFDRLSQYETQSTYLGCMIGRERPIGMSACIGLASCRPGETYRHVCAHRFGRV
jgi:hypothetical protein